MHIYISLPGLAAACSVFFSKGDLKEKRERNNIWYKTWRTLLEINMSVTEQLAKGLQRACCDIMIFPRWPFCHRSMSRLAFFKFCILFSFFVSFFLVPHFCYSFVISFLCLIFFLKINVISFLFRLLLDFMTHTEHFFSPYFFSLLTCLYTTAVCH